MKAYSFPYTDTPIVKGRTVITVGGGNVAMDCARTALRMGAERSMIVYRRAEEQMPARLEEIHHAKEEGVEFNLLNNPVKLVGDENGWLKGAEVIKMELGQPDASGRRRPIPIEGSEYIIDAEVLIVAIGNSPNPLVPASYPELDVTNWGGIIVNEVTGQTSVPGVFAGGDIVLGAATVILAMGHGRRAARAMNLYLSSGKWSNLENGLELCRAEVR